MAYSSKQCELFDGPEHGGQSLKTSQDSSVQTQEPTLLLWLERWLGYGLTYRSTDGKTPVFSSGQRDWSSGQFWTANSSEFRSGAVASSLSEILETGPVDRRYYLTEKACKGILRRAEKRGKKLPAQLEQALLAVSGGAAVNEDGAQTLTGAEPSYLLDGGNNTSGPIDVATACRAKGGSGHGDFESETFITGPVLANGKAAGSATQQDAEQGMLVPTAFKASHFTRGKDGAPSDVAPPLSADADKGDQDTLIAFSCKDSGLDCGELSPTLRGMGHDSSHANAGGQVAIAIQERAVCENPDAGPDGVGVRTDDTAYTVEARHVPQAVCFDTTQVTSPGNYSNPKPGDPCHPLAAEAHVPAVAFESRFARNDRGAPDEIVPPLKAQSGQSGKGDAAPLTMTGMQVRRLTPVECCRLQSVPDDHFDGVLMRGKPLADGPKYKLLGNGLCVNVVAYIGSRIQMIEDLKK